MSAERRLRQRSDRTALAQAAGWTEWLVGAVAVLIAVATRWAMLRYASGDFDQYTSEWYGFIQQNGGAEALRQGISNYTPPYVYGMIVVHWLFPELAPVVALKLIGLPFDFVGAIFAGRIVALRYRDPLVPVLAASAYLFAPTVVLNGAFWGQVDGIGASAVLACVYFVLCGRDTAALVAFGLGLAFKLQPIFLLPMLAVLVLRQRLDWRWFAVVPAIYLVAILPAWLAGRPLSQLLMVYAGQADFYQRLSSNAPHVFAWFPNQFYSYLYPAGLYWAVGILFLATTVAVRVTRELTFDRILQLALISLILVPYCLPKMHERYFFLADALAVPFAFVFPRLAVPAVLIIVTSFCSYAPFLLHQEIVPMLWLPFVLGSVLVILLREYASGLRQNLN